MNPTSYREALIETAADEADGADILLVIVFLSIEGQITEFLVCRRCCACLRRAGADIILTYFAGRQAANLLSGMRPVSSN
uniref:Porphobilinogen synthase n=1 Tax=Oryza barthii TaxID=65489 RepID=A0A0D3F0G2_9ORYZ